SVDQEFPRSCCGAAFAGIRTDYDECSALAATLDPNHVFGPWNRMGSPQIKPGYNRSTASLERIADFASVQLSSNLPRAKAVSTAWLWFLSRNWVSLSHPAAASAKITALASIGG